MDNEIKEILEALRDSIDDTGTDKVNFINWVDKIEDYITNLEQKYQDAINQSIEDHKYASKKEDEALDYKSRIEKAVEYINNNLLYSEDFDYDEEDNLVWQGARCDTQSEDLLNILNGRSDE